MTVQRDALLFLMRSPLYVRNFELVLERLGSSGLRATVLFEERKDVGDAAGLRLMQRLCGEHESLAFGFLPPEGPPGGPGLSPLLRRALPRCGEAALARGGPRA